MSEAAVPTGTRIVQSLRLRKKGRFRNPRQRTHYSRITCVIPGDFPERLRRFQVESGLSWSEIARRLRTG